MASVRWLLVVLAFGMLSTAFAGCLSGNQDASDQDADEPTRVTGTTAPPVTPGNYKFDEDFAQVLAPGPYTDVLPVELASLPSDVDGADVQIAVWRPVVPDGMKVPVIVDAGPYYPADLTDAMGGHIFRLASNFNSHGYAVAAVPVRGTGDNGGCMDLMGAMERADLDQAVTWLGTQPWSNGKVALIGASYDGSTPFEVASMGNPYLATIVPVSGLTDIFNLMFRNGTSEWRGPVVLNALYYTYGMGGGPNSDRDPVKSVQGAICPESWEGLEASAFSGITGGYDPDGWWRERDSRPGILANYRGSILHIHGLKDTNVDPGLNIPWIDDYAQETGITLHQWLGQWGHAFPDSYCNTNIREDNRQAFANCRYDWAEYLLRWFDYWLKGFTTLDLGPAVQIQDQDKIWRVEENFPPHDAEWVTYEVSSPSELVPFGTTADAGFVRLFPNPACTDLNPSQLCLEEDSARSTVSVSSFADFYTTPFERDVRISGLPQVPLTVVPEGPGGIVGANLYRLEADGSMTKIGWGSINLRFADGTATPREVMPGQELKLALEIQPMDARLPAGSQLILRVWCAAPGDRFYSAAPGVVSLQIGNEQSLLNLPTVDRPAESYFEVPWPPGENPIAPSA